MIEDMVMRSVYLRPTEDNQLRQLAHELKVSKSDLIRSAISVKLQEWLRSGGKELVMRDLKFGRRTGSAGSATGVVADPSVSEGRPVKPTESEASAGGGQRKVPAEAERRGRSHDGAPAQPAAARARVKAEEYI